STAARAAFAAWISSPTCAWRFCLPMSIRLAISSAPFRLPPTARSARAADTPAGSAPDWEECGASTRMPSPVRSPLPRGPGRLQELAPAAERQGLTVRVGEQVFQVGQTAVKIRGVGELFAFARDFGQILENAGENDRIVGRGRIPQSRFIGFPGRGELLLLS